MSLPQSCTVSEFGERHGLWRATVYKEIASGRLRSSKIGRRLISDEAERDWQRRHELEAA